MKCLNCGFTGMLKTGKFYKDPDTQEITDIPMWKCGRCGVVRKGYEHFERQTPKTLYIDIETSLTETRNFGLKVSGEWLSYKMVKRPFFIICWAALWTDNPARVFAGCVTSQEALSGADKNILAPLWDLMNNADVIAGHNSDQFDIPRITGRFLLNGFQKLEKFKTQDTKKMAKKHKFESNSLDYLCEVFGLPKKEDMPIEEWIAISDSGDEKALRRMQKYNVGDVKKRGYPVYNILSNYQDWPNDAFVRRFPREPKWKNTDVVK